MFWISSSFSDYVFQVDILPFFRSDHVYLKLAFPSLPDRGPGVSKLNTSILHDETLSTEVRVFGFRGKRKKILFHHKQHGGMQGKPDLDHCTAIIPRIKLCQDVIAFGP